MKIMQWRLKSWIYIKNAQNVARNLFASLIAIENFALTNVKIMKKTASRHTQNV
jgi:hypothetical protein